MCVNIEHVIHWRIGVKYSNTDVAGERSDYKESKVR